MISGESSIRRRRFLKALVASAGGTILAGCQGLGSQSTPGSTRTGKTVSSPDEPGTPGPPVVESTRTGEDTTARTQSRTPRQKPAEGQNFDTVVNMIRAGADPEGDRPINALLEEYAGDDTLLYFPSGTYHMDDSWEFREFRNFGIVGDDAVIIPPDGYQGFLIAVGWSDRAVGFLFKGFTFDITAPDTGIRPLQAVLQDRLHVADVTVRGIQDVDQDCMRFDVTLGDGSGLVENLRLPDGGVARYPNTGVYVGEVTDGTLTFRNCHIAGFPDNGLYASEAEGPIRVIGGRYENNNVASIRVSSDALVRGATVRATTAQEGFNNVRGIRLRSGRDILVENCNVVYSEVERSDGAITLHNWLESATIRNTTIRVDTDDVTGLLAKEPQWDIGDDDPPTIRLEGIRITGTAANKSAVEIVNRDGCELADFCIHQTGRRRNGIRMIDSEGGTLQRSSIVVTGDPIVLDDSTLDTSDIRTARPSPAFQSNQCPGRERQAVSGTAHAR